MESNSKKRIKETYYIKKGYIPNEENIILDILPREIYWNKKRIIKSYYYQYYIYKFALDLIKERKIKSIIDLGCGVGIKSKFIHNRFPDLIYIGIDQKEAIEYCTTNYDFGDWYINDIENPLLDSNFEKADLVISSDVIEHLNNPSSLLKYLKFLVKKDGLILISTPERDLLRGKSCLECPNKFHIREWNASEFKKYIESKGFKILKHELCYPIKITISAKIEYIKAFYSEIIKRFIFRKALKYNQLLLLKSS